jgi:type II secretory pathway component PulJ
LVTKRTQRKTTPAIDTAPPPAPVRRRVGSEQAPRTAGSVAAMLDKVARAQEELTARDARIAELEARVASLEASLSRSSAVLPALLARLRERSPEVDPELVETVSSLLDAMHATDEILASLAPKIEDASDAARSVGAREVASAIAFRLLETKSARTHAQAVIEALEKIAARIVEIDLRERKLAKLRKALLADAKPLLEEVLATRKALGKLRID